VVRNLIVADIREIWRTRKIDGVKTDEVPFDDAYRERFQTALDQETFNMEHRLTIVAASLDTDTPRILEYLADDYNVPVNAPLFSHFVDEGREYLTRTWLRPPSEDDTKPGPKRANRGQKKTWNGRHVFVPLCSQGRETGDRWRPCLAYGFVGAGGGRPYWRFIERLEAGITVFGYVGGAGYIGVGEVTGPLVPLRDFTVEQDGAERRVIDLPECPAWVRASALDEDADLTEYAAPVRWLATRPLEQAFFEPGLTAQQLPCRLTDQNTIDLVEAEFGLAQLGFSELSPTERLDRVGPEVRALFDEVAAVCLDRGLARSDRKWWVNIVDADGSAVVGVSSARRT
jgi:hypothetical protein